MGIFSRSVRILLLGLELFLSASAFAQGVRLSWDPVPDAGVTRYVVYRRPDDGMFDWVADAGLATSIEISDLVPGEGYSFAVAAYAEDYGDFSSELYYFHPPSTGSDTPPTALDKFVTVAEDSTVSVKLVGSDPEGKPVSFLIVRAPAQGTLSGSPPDVVYRPKANFVGTDTFTFSVSDGVLRSRVAQVSITVTPVNDAPVATGSSWTVLEDGAVSVVLGGSDVEGSALTYTIMQAPTNGVVTGVAPNLTYRPRANYYGPDALSFRVSDGLLTSTLATVNFTVTPLNDRPVARSGVRTVAEDGTLILSLTGIDAEPGVLTFAIVQPPTNGVVSGVSPNFVYRPAANFFGTDKLRFTVSDGLLTSASEEITITVTPVNDAPSAVSTSLEVTNGIPRAVVLDGLDVDGDALTFLIVQAPTHGVLVGVPPMLTYTADVGYTGPDSFQFTVKDAVLTSIPASVALNVVPPATSPPNYPPNATPTSYVVPEDGAVAVVFRGSDVEGSALTYTIVQAPTNGVVTGVAPNLTYRPRADYFGPDALRFTVSDGSLTSTPATVDFTVTPLNDRPVARSGVRTVAEDGTLILSLTGIDAEPGLLTFAIVQPPTNGVVSGVSPNFVYRPAANFFGTDKLRFTVSDGLLTSASEEIAITVTPVNDAPSAVSTSLEVTNGIPRAVALGGLDVDGDALTFLIVQAPTHGVLIGVPPMLTYTADVGYTGPDSFQFTARDAVLTSPPATVAITVSARSVQGSPLLASVGHRTTSAPDSAPLSKGVLVVDRLGTGEALLGGGRTLFGESAETGSDVVEVRLVEAPKGGSIELRRDGTFRYQHLLADSPVDKFAYEVVRADGSKDSGQVEVMVFSILGVHPGDPLRMLDLQVSEGMVCHVEYFDSEGVPGDWSQLLTFVAPSKGVASIADLSAADSSERWYRCRAEYGGQQWETDAVGFRRLVFDR